MTRLKDRARMSTKWKGDGLMRTVAKLRTKKRSKPDSERDSGFSDASSEYLSAVGRTGREDASSAGGSGSGAGAPRSHPSQLAVVGGSFPNLSPMIIMNNVQLKQPGETPPAMKPWGFSPAVEVVQQPQVVFLQPVVSHRGPAVQKGPSAKRRRHKKYLPILRSYPKIAPHPGDSPLRSSSSSSSCSSSSSSVKSSSLASSPWERHHRDKQRSCQTSSSGCSTPSLPTTPCSPPASPTPHALLTDSNAASRPVCDRPVQAASRPELTLTPTPVPTETKGPGSQLQDVSEHWGDHDNGFRGSSASDCSDKRKRFCNTYNILSRSGLLDITLRTKELIRQNRRTQGQIERLREHTSLLLEALRTTDSHVWTKLQASMQEEEKEGEKADHNGAEMDTETRAA